MPAKLENFVSNTLSSGAEISLSDLTEKIKSRFPQLKDNTLQVYISRLKKSGIIKNPSRGTYSSESKPTFRFPVNQNTKTIFDEIQNQYHYINFCIWDTSILNDFMIYQAFRTYQIIEVERDAVNQVFQFLSQTSQNIYLNPKTEVFQNYINPNPNSVTIVKILKSEAPVNTLESLPLPTLEKILVDIVSDPEIFSAQQDELEHIFETALERYAINKQNLLRYAARRNRKEEIKNFISEALAIN
jgi:hypothetical protein